jgi:hypothetical protein
MDISSKKYVLFFVATGVLLSAVTASAKVGKRAFTVSDDIGMTVFGDPGTGLRFSPDGNYFVVYTERGRLDANLVEDSLRVYRSRDVENFVEHSDWAQPPSPVWDITLSTDKEGPIIKDWRWLSDSSGLAFLQSWGGGRYRLVLADIRNKTVEQLTPASEMVKTFDVHDRDHYAYTVADPADRERVESERRATAIVGTGRHIDELLFEADPDLLRWLWHRCNLWAVVGGKRFEVNHDGGPLVLFGGNLALSPDGRFLITTLPVQEVPRLWETLYPPAFASSPYRIRVGHLDVHSGRGSAMQYVRIDLQTGVVQALIDAPTSNSAGWWAPEDPSWSSDGEDVLLPGTFIKSKDHMPSRPCVAVVDVRSNEPTCVEMLKGHTETGVEEGYHRVDETRFVGAGGRRVLVMFSSHEDQSVGTTEYRRATNGTWRVTGQGKGVPVVGRGDFEVSVRQGLNEPPLLVAKRKERTRVVWDPNPHLQEIELGEASVYKWKDKNGRRWRGGLYKPGDYKIGQRYPLVIQTHGFSETEFRPAGAFPTAFASRALAAAGMIVLQVDDDQCITVNPNEGPCAVFGYEAAVDQLTSEGLVDPEKIGMIGFSRSCYYVMEVLTTGSLHLKAASITSGWMVTYLQYIEAIGPDTGATVAHEANSMIGAAPFGMGLQQWLKQSPGFNLDKVTAPLLVVAVEGPPSLLAMWEPYAGLRYLNRPVDLLMLNTDEHVLTNPAGRMASQGGSVDWFRFWLKGEEDPDPIKTEQYTRWHGLRKLQEANEKSRPSEDPADGS